MADNSQVTLSIDSLGRLFYDHDFRRLFPEHSDAFTKYFSKPGCGCNNPLYVAVATSPKLKEFFGDRPISLGQDILALIEGKKPTPEWWVINTTKDQLIIELESLPKGNKTVAIARDGDNVTAVVRNLDIDFD